MSIDRIDKLLNDDMSTFIPVPQKKINVTTEDPLSKRLRQFNDSEIKFPSRYQAGVYINTNELNVKQIFSELAALPPVKQAIHIGFSGWYNLDIIAQRKTSRALICDINPENALFFHYTLKYVKKFKDKEDFVKKMDYFVKKSHYEGSRSNVGRARQLAPVKPKGIKFSYNISEEYPIHYSITEEIALETKRETSWLYNKEPYAYIRHLALTDKIAVITANICASDTFSSISRLLENNAIQIDTVYASNIGEWMITEKKQTNFTTTINALTKDKETILIDAKKPFGFKDSTPSQRCILKKDLKLEHWFFSPKSVKTETEKLRNLDDPIENSPKTDENINNMT